MPFPDRIAQAPNIEPPSTTISRKVRGLPDRARNKMVLAISLRTGDFTERYAEFKLFAETANTLLFGIFTSLHNVRCISVSVEPCDTTLQRTPARQLQPYG